LSNITDEQIKLFIECDLFWFNQILGYKERVILRSSPALETLNN